MLLDALASLAEQTVSVQTVVVDNGSSDGSPQAVQRDFPDACVLELPSNQGFGHALNHAVERHPADILIFSNNDVRHPPHFVEALLDEAGRDSATVAGVLVQADDPSVIDSAGVVVDSTLLAFDYLYGYPLGALRVAKPPLGPTGGAALLPLAAFSAVGGFDERIFAYLEDVDLALRLRAARIPCRLAVEARSRHRHSATLGSGSAAKNRLMGWSRGYMLRRYGVLMHPGRAARALAAESVICAGQLIVDRTVSGIEGRLRGWRAANGLPNVPIPPGSTLEITLLEALLRRAGRRWTRIGSRADRTAPLEGIPHQ